MPRKLLGVSLDELEREVDATIIALDVEEEAAALREATAGWPALVDGLRGEVRAQRRASLRLAARRARVNRRLDAMCADFARQLRVVLADDRKHPRWVQFFKMTPSAFVRQPLEDQVRAVRGWLSTEEPTLAASREALAALCTEAEGIFAEEAAQGHAVAALRGRRDDVAGALTKQRDALHRRLAEVAAERDLERSWADGFFLRG